MIGEAVGRTELSNDALKATPATSQASAAHTKKKSAINTCTAENVAGY